ncbi:PREDICTED: trihelix transcription factor GTL1-like [Trachymyrmex cornetzi]|uniref:trihelix transcription factor GTL1-like n=1 Tax=Trachymyrmex cornetzi TaxID=471704 RepID=UPI00084F4890|nr:PREDICTED: trihelix transcription factor GTL1-like [Trachymyrmex cornetzi]
MDSLNIRKIYNLQHSSFKNIKSQVQSALSTKEFQQHSSTMINQTDFNLLNKPLQESSCVTKNQPPSLIVQLPSTSINRVQSSALTDKQYSQPPYISNPIETNVLNTDKPYEKVLSQSNNNAGSQVQVTLPKTKRRKTVDTPRASWKHPAILCLIHHYKANMHVMNSNSKRHEEIWQDISDALAKEGYYFSHLQCEDKWKYLKKVYIETVDKNKESGTAENTCPYFKEFHDIYSKSHSVNPPALASNRILKNISECESFSQSDSEEKNVPKKKSRNSKQLDT